MTTQHIDIHAMPGFAQPVHDSQSVFRTVLEAMSHPGEIVRLHDLPEAPVPLNRMSAAICLTLVDFEMPLWVDGEIASHGQAMSHLQFHCGCPIATNPKDARTAIVSSPASLDRLDRFDIGTDERPDLSSTVIVQVSGLVAGEGMRLTGPGIQSINRIHVEGAGAKFWNCVRANNQLFPRGVDLILTTDDSVVCLPRTTVVEV